MDEPNLRECIWVERYRPKTISDCILPERIKKTFQEIVDSGTLPNLMLHGKAGVGKTTAAHAMCDELNISPLFINASESGNIDTLRTEIRDYSSTRSFDGSRKCVILDEADHLNPLSTQPALRGFIEEFYSNVSFIFTANNLGKIIQPLHSRCAVIEYTIPSDERKSLANQFLKRLKRILKLENIEYDPKVVSQLILRHFPDFRRTINELQRHSLGGQIDADVLIQVHDVPMSELISAITESDFKAIRKWCGVHADDDSVKIMRKLYDALYEVFDPKCIPDLTLILGEYLYKAAFAQDQEMNLAACMTQIMLSSQVKTTK